VAVQEDHDLAHHLLFGPGGDDPTSSYRTESLATSTNFLRSGLAKCWPTSSHLGPCRWCA
jgi:hypothetical protein